MLTFLLVLYRFVLKKTTLVKSLEFDKKALL